MLRGVAILTWYPHNEHDQLFHAQQGTLQPGYLCINNLKSCNLLHHSCNSRSKIYGNIFYTFWCQYEAVCRKIDWARAKSFSIVLQSKFLFVNNRFNPFLLYLGRRYINYLCFMFFYFISIQGFFTEVSIYCMSIVSLHSQVSIITTITMNLTKLVRIRFKNIGNLIMTELKTNY